MLVFRSETNRKMLENHENAGRLRRLSSGIYSSDLETDPAVQIRQNLVRVLAYLRPGAVISHRSAILPDFGASEGLVVVTEPALSGNYIHNLPGLIVLATPGPGPLASDARLDGIYASSPWRAVLENQEPHRVIRVIGRAKQADTEASEAFLERNAITQATADGFLQGVALVVAATGKWAREQRSVDQLMQKKRAKAARQPLFLSPLMDQRRVVLFEGLAQQLRRGIHGNETLWGDGLSNFPARPVIGDNRFLNLAFYESYFSNYIEGTEFTPEDAHDIALDERVATGQSKEWHDIRALYKLYATPEMFLREDHSPGEFLENLKYWHAWFGEHKDKESIRPGQFKEKANRAGSTWFADPAQVEGTLCAAWEIGNALEEPFDHAVFRAVSTVSVHPFLDGNGRITRLAASNILGRVGKIRLMIPTVFREDYILALQAFSNGDPMPVIRMFKRAADITSSVPFVRDFGSLTAWLKARNGFASPDQAKWESEGQSAKSWPRPPPF
ncbi:MAG: Fic family protein [Acidiferrobacter sp.]